MTKKIKTNADEKDKSLPIMHWTLKIYKDPIAARFIVAQKNCSAKLISKAISKAFKFIFHQIQSFYDIFVLQVNNFRL